MFGNLVFSFCRIAKGEFLECRQSHPICKCVEHISKQHISKIHSQKYIYKTLKYVNIYINTQAYVVVYKQCLATYFLPTIHMSQQAKNSPLEYILVHRVFLLNNDKVRSENRCTRIISSSDCDWHGYS